MVQPLWRTVWRLLKKLKIDFYDPAVPLLDIYLKKTKTLICMPVFAVELSTIAKIWKQPKCPPIGEWIKKMYIYHTHNRILLSHKKK